MYYKLGIKEVLEKVHSSVNGLSESEAKERLNKYGKNEIRKLKEISKLKLFLRQLKSFIVYVLLAAVVISLFFREYNNVIVISIVVIINTFLGFFQEYKAEKAIEALQKLSSPMALVIRSGKLKQISSHEVVIGDIVVIEEGSYIPADSRLIEANSLYIDESTLTGESVSVEKSIKTIEMDEIISNQNDMLFAGTMTVRGRGKAVVVATAFDTELGKIAKEIQLAEEKITPLQRRLEIFGRYITIAILILVGIIFLLNFLRGTNVLDSLLTSIALGVAAIPEGLPAVITITLALGTQRMLKKNVLVRRLSAVETLGGVTHICTDKTGTLTKNEMTVVEVYTNNKMYKVSGSGYSLEGGFFINEKKANAKTLTNLFSVAYLCNNATLEGPSDPTEKALLVLAKKGKYDKNYERILEVPFTSETKLMITGNKINGSVIQNMKGAPEVVLNKCRYIEVDGEIKTLTKTDKENILENYKSMAENALRVLALAYSKDTKNFIFIGLVGMIDPPREGVKSSIEECKKAGIKIIMITGDYEITAKAIASQIGIEGEAINGEQLEKMSVRDLERIIDSVVIYARVNPEHKVKILKALKNKGYVVAMTGDGVNDALALENSDIGTAVGSGTDVAKQASDMILLDDNFVSIVDAIREGRGIYNNLKKFIKFLFSTNLAEVLIIFLALILGWPLPLIAIQILWVNLLSDGFPALALGVDPIEKNIMSKPPRKIRENIINKRDLIQLLLEGIVITGLVLALYSLYLGRKDLIYAQTVAFTALVITELFNSIGYRVDGRSIFSRDLFKNKYFWISIFVSVVLQLVVVYYFNDLFKTAKLALIDWVWIAVAGCIVLILKEFARLIHKKEVIINN